MLDKGVCAEVRVGREHSGFATETALIRSELFPGDTLALYTDGISETLNDRGEEFGEQRLAELVRQHVKLPSQALLTSVVSEVQRFGSREQQDDITLIVAKCR